MRKQRSDSAAAAVRAVMNGALPPLAPPLALSPAANKFWPGIVHARARDEWTAIDLVLGCQLAEAQAQIEHESALLRAEGTIVETSRGTRVANPRFGIVQGLASRELALMRTLLMGGASAGRDRRDLQLQRRAEAAARSVHAAIIDDDGLLA